MTGSHNKPPPPSNDGSPRRSPISAPPSDSLSIADVKPTGGPDEEAYGSEGDGPIGVGGMVPAAGPPSGADDGGPPVDGRPAAGPPAIEAKTPRDSVSISFSMVAIADHSVPPSGIPNAGI